MNHRIYCWIVLFASLAASSAYAGDGRIEINQARALAGGVTPGDAAGFPANINQPGSYVLTSDLVVSSGTGISITSSDVTIDLNGFSIVGPVTCSGTPPTCSGSGSAIGITSVGAGNEIHNGTVRGFDGGGVRLQAGPNQRVADLLVTQNAGIGIEVGFGFNNSVVRGCVVTDNLGDGILSGLRCLIQENLVTNNGEAAIDVSNGCLVAGNRIAGLSPGTEPALATGPGLQINAVGYRDNVISGTVTVDGQGVDLGEPLQRVHDMSVMLRRGAFARSLGVVAALLWVGSPSSGQVLFTPDVSVSLPGFTAHDEDLVLESGGSFSLSNVLPLIPTPVALSSFYPDGSDVLFSIDSTAILEGQTIEPRDVVRWDGSTLTIELDGSAEGIPDGLRIDALALGNVNGNLLVSIDGSAAVGTLDVDDEDLFRIHPSPLLIFDGSAEGIDPALDLDAASLLPSGVGLLSFDGSGTVAGIDFDDEDILSWDPGTGSFGLYFDGSAKSAALVPADVTVIPEPASGGLLGSGALLMLGLSRHRGRTDRRARPKQT